MISDELPRYAMYSMQKVLLCGRAFRRREMDGYWIHLLFLVGLIPKAGLGYLKIVTNKRGYKKLR